MSVPASRSLLLGLSLLLLPLGSCCSPGGVSGSPRSSLMSVPAPRSLLLGLSLLLLPLGSCCSPGGVSGSPRSSLMSVPAPRSLLLGLSLLLLPLGSGAWEPDLELFDLVEETPQNFYSLLGVDQAAPAAEIKKAYRRLSLVLHPDKNKDEDAEDKFRQLVAVYEVLKDEERRRRYDDILENGLPDWRQPVFYYRRVRKMSNGELGVFLCLALTIGHFAVLWSIYLEKQLDELLSRKRREKKKKTSSRTEDRDRTQERPQWQDLLPLKVSVWIYVSLRNLPQILQEVKNFYEEQQQEKRRLKEEEEEEEETQTQRKVKVKKPKVEFPVYDPALDGLHDNGGGLHGGGLHGYDAAAIEEIEEQMDDWLQEKKRPKKKVSDWSDEELSLLSRLMVKFPGGTPGRWEKIALDLNRSVSEVTTKVKQVKEVIQPPTGLVKLSELKAPPPATPLPADDDITQREEGEEPVTKRRSQAKVKGRRQADFDPDDREEEEEPSPAPSGPAPSGPAPWTQNQQRLLELALTQFPRGTPERWTRISATVPGRTKDECMARYKTLAELVQRRRQTKAS